MESTNLPSNNSNQQLMDDDSDGLETRAPSINSESPKSFRTVTKTQWITVAVLCYVNLINYMDRFTMAGKSSIRIYDKKKFNPPPAEKKKMDSLTPLNLKIIKSN